MRVGSVCSGIEAAAVAWEPLGWRFVFSADIDPFANAVRTHRFPDVPNYGDMSKYEEWPDAAIDLLVGGTPCQSFSVAGLRAGLSDERGNLALTFIRIADKYNPEYVLWENVPGVLSDKTNAFGAFLGGLCGAGEPLVPDGRWANAGVVAGPKRTAAWRVLDAQYFGVAQRRRRVFVLAVRGARDWRSAAALFPLSESGSGHPPTRRKSGEGLAAATARGFGDGGENRARTVRTGEGKRQDYEICTLVAHSLRGEGFDGSEDGTGRGTPLVPVAFHPTQEPINSVDVCHALNANANANATAAVAFHENQRGEVSVSETAGALKVGGGKPGQGYPAVAQAMQVRRLTPRECERLQGFPDDYTLIPYRGKPAADGPRYKALGNSFAVPVVRWIGKRIERVEALAQRQES